MVSDAKHASTTPNDPVDGALALSSQSGDFIQSRGVGMASMYHTGAN